MILESQVKNFLPPPPKKPKPKKLKTKPKQERWELLMEAEAS